MPRLPYAQSEIGAVKRLLFNACDAPASLYVETFLPAALEAFSSIIYPDAREAYHKIGGKSLVCSAKEGLRDALHDGGVNPGRFTRFLFRFAEYADLAVWYTFLADVASTGLFNWSTQIYRMSGCANNMDPKSGPGGKYPSAIGDNGTWDRIEWVMPDFSNFSPVWTGDLLVPINGFAVISANAKFTDFGGNPVPTSTRIRNVTHDYNIDIDNSFESDDGAFGGAKVFTTFKNDHGADVLINLEHSCSEGNLPLHEAFPDAANHCFIYGSWV